MRLRTLAAATAVGLVASLAPTVAAEAAPKKPTFKVSINTSAAKADVGQTIKVSGKVTGPRAAKKRLLVQRKIGTARWTTVAKVRTTAKRRYAANVKVTTAGAQQFRVVAPKTKKARLGISTTRNLTGWRWIDPSTNAFVEDGLTRGVITVDGTRYSQVWTPTGNSYGSYYARLDGACDALTVGLGVEGGRNSTAGYEIVQLESWTAPDALADGGKQISGNSGLVQTRWPLSARTGIVILGMFVNPENAERGGMVNPLVHCSVNSLPKTVLPSAAAR